MDQVQEAKDQAREKIQEAGGQAKGRVRDEVDRRSSEAGERVTAAASDARSVGEELRRQGKDRPAELADRAASRAERVGSYLQESDADRILGDVEDFGRRQPWAVVASAFAIGFVASRFLKASSRDRYQASHSAVNGSGANRQALGGPPLIGDYPAPSRRP
jgi:ElaB/YqjD/DUF883 family membrane-anchored ribosome-binding protein